MLGAVLAVELAAVEVSAAEDVAVAGLAFFALVRNSAAVPSPDSGGFTVLLKGRELADVDGIGNEMCEQDGSLSALTG